MSGLPSSGRFWRRRSFERFPRGRDPRAFGDFELLAFRRFFPAINCGPVVGDCSVGHAHAWRFPVVWVR